MVRCFIGIGIPDEIRDHVIRIQNKLKILPMEAKFVEPENLHISLSFLGDVENGAVENVSNTLDKICGNYTKFMVTINRIKLIPNENFVRVIVLDVTNEKLNNLGGSITKQIGGDGKPPHLTLCRVKKILDKNLFQKSLTSITPSTQTFEVIKVSLFKSVLQKSGPTYSILHESRLK